MFGGQVVWPVMPFCSHTVLGNEHQGRVLFRLVVQLVWRLGPEDILFRASQPPQLAADRPAAIRAEEQLGTGDRRTRMQADLWIISQLTCILVGAAIVSTTAYLIVQGVDIKFNR